MSVCVRLAYASRTHTLIPDQRTILNYSVTQPKYSNPEWCRDDLSKLLDLLAQEKVKPIIAERIPLVEVARAHELLEKGSATGKIVLICNIDRIATEAIPAIKL